MKITKHILTACILTGMAACDTDKEIAVFNEDSGAIMYLQSWLEPSRHFYDSPPLLRFEQG